MSAFNILKKPYARKPYKPRNVAPFGCMPLKMFRMNEAQKHHCSEGQIHLWIYAGHYPGLKFIRVNKRVVFVKP